MVKGALIFPAAAALAWAVLAYACIDFGFFQRIFPITEATEQVYRAGAEAVLAATLLVFLFAYLNLNRWHVRYSHVTAFWLLFLGGLVALAIVDPPVASGVARMSIAAVAGIGFVLVIHLATHGYDRAVMLVPTWLLLVAWVTAASFTVVGQLTSDLVPPALVGGLVLMVMLIGFTVMQHAFAGGAFTRGFVNDTERRALALTGAGDIVFDWDVVSDNIFVSPEVEHQLGLKRGSLEGPASAWLDLIHPFDKDRYRLALDAVIEQRRGRLTQDFRLRSASGAHNWFRLKARPVIGSDGEVHAHRRHARRRHGQQDRRGAPAARRRARQPDEPAEPAALLRPAGSRPHLRRARTMPCAPPCSSSISTSSRRSMTLVGLRCGRFDSPHPVPPPRAACSSRRIPWRASRATNSPSSCCPSASPTGSSPSPTWSAAW